MKVSELIKTLTHLQAIEGDIPVSITVADDIILSDSNIYVDIDKYPEHKEINIRNFMY